MSKQDPAGYAAVVQHLFGLTVRGRKFGIDRMRVLVEALNHPDQAVPCLHVAGTNGKGSVAAMIDAILQAAGWRTGLYTSPHLVKVGERVQVNRQPLGEEEIVAYFAELQPLAAQIAAADPDSQPSFFEYMTAMAFLQFARKRCNIAVFEVGLGGRLDATNVVMPEVSVITSIGMDHGEILGHDLELIASEKAGIVKAGRPVVIGRMPRVAEFRIRSIAAQRGSPVFSVGEAYGDDLGRYPQTNLEGDYQRWNAATATLAVRALEKWWRITNEVIAEGLRKVDWPGRWQRLRIGGRVLILDAAHNPEGAEVLDENLRQLRAETGRAPIVITGALGAERAGPLLETICRHAGEIHLVVPNQPRACSHAALESLLPADCRVRVTRDTVADLFPAPGCCTAGGPDDTMVVTGSIYLIGEVMARLGTME